MAWGTGGEMVRRVAFWFTAILVVIISGCYYYQQHQKKVETIPDGIPPLKIERLPSDDNTKSGKNVFQTQLQSHWQSDATSHSNERILTNLITEFKSRSLKVLKTADEEKAYHEMLSSAGNLRTVLNALSEIPKDFSEHELENRMDEVRFIDEALSWADNQEKAWLIQQVEGIVSRPISSLDIPLEAKQLLGGDKMELYGILATISPQEARKVLGKTVKNRKDLALLEYSHNMYGLSIGLPE